MWHHAGQLFVHWLALEYDIPADSLSGQRLRVQRVQRVDLLEVYCLPAFTAAAAAALKLRCSSCCCTSRKGAAANQYTPQRLQQSRWDSKCQAKQQLNRVLGYADVVQSSAQKPVAGSVWSASFLAPYTRYRYHQLVFENLL